MIDQICDMFIAFVGGLAARSFVCYRGRDLNGQVRAVGSENRRDILCVGDD